MDHKCEINDFSKDVVCKYVQVILQYSNVFKLLIHTYFTYGYFLRVIFLRKNMNFKKLHSRIFLMVSSVYITETFNIRRAKCFDNSP